MFWGACHYQTRQWQYYQLQWRCHPVYPAADIVVQRHRYITFQMLVEGRDGLLGKIMVAG